MIIFNKSLKGVQIYNYSLCCKNIFDPFTAVDSFELGSMGSF
jgi:hypothetical protein